MTRTELVYSANGWDTLFVGRNIAIGMQMQCNYNNAAGFTRDAPVLGYFSRGV